MAELLIYTVFLFFCGIQVQGQFEIGRLRSQLDGVQSRLQQGISTSGLLQSRMAEDIQGWYFPAPELQQELEGAVTNIGTILVQAQSYYDGANRLMNTIEGINGEIQPEWLDRINTLQAMSNEALLNAEETISVINRYSADIAADQEAYAEAKEVQMRITKAIMDDELQQLLQQTLEVGQQASKVLNQAIKDWSSTLQKYLGVNAEATINRLLEVTQRISYDFSRLRPEDIETSMQDTHHAVEDVKTILLGSGVPANVVRHVINSPHLGLMTILTRGKNASYNLPNFAK